MLKLPSKFKLLMAAAALAATVSHGQEVRRAEPVTPDDTSNDNVPTGKAVPFDSFESPTPAPSATPAPPATVPVDVGGEATPAPSAGPVNEESSDEVQLDYANGFYARNQFDMAAPEYERYLNLYPTAAPLDRESAMFRLGECYRKLGNVNAAKNSYQTLLLDFGIGQFIGPAAYRLADMCFTAGDYEGALDYYRKASVRLQDPMVALSATYQSARCLEQLNLPAEARVTYEDIVATEGDNPYREPSRLALAELLSSDGRKSEALDEFETLAKEATQPTVKVEAYVKAGMLNVDLNQPSQAAVDLNKALQIPEIGQWKPIAQIGLMRVLYESGKYQDLINQYQDAFNDLPDDIKPEVLLLAANSKRQTSDYAGASVLYQQIVQTYPASQYAGEARYQNLVSLYNANDPGLMAAVNDYLTNNPDPAKQAQVTLLKAESLFKDQKYADAAPVYASLQGSTLDAAFQADALFKLGWCYMQTQQPQQAITALTTFLQSYPDNSLVPSALAQRAVAYQQTHDLTSALKDFDEVLSDYPTAKERELALQQKALILGEQQDNPGMSQTFQQLLQEFPHSSAAAQANYWIGSAAFSAKDYKACIDPLKKARDLDRAQFFERATLRIILADYTLEDRDSLASEVDLYNGGKPKDKVQVDVLRWLGQSYLKDKQFGPAEKYLEQLSGRSEATPQDWLDLGSAQLGDQKYPDAIDSVNKYLAAVSDPASQAQGLLVLGSAQLESAKLDDAQASADKACSLQPEGLPNAQGRMLSGDIQIARSEPDAAAKIFESIAVIIDDPQLTPLALEKAYDCLNQEGNTAEAAKVLNDLQTKYPEYQVNSNSNPLPLY
jgi:TolA-binding protein